MSGKVFWEPKQHRHDSKTCCVNGQLRVAKSVSKANDRCIIAVFSVMGSVSLLLFDCSDRLLYLQLSSGGSKGFREYSRISLQNHHWDHVLLFTLGVHMPRGWLKDDRRFVLLPIPTSFFYSCPFVFVSHACVFMSTSKYTPVLLVMVYFA